MRGLGKSIIGTQIKEMANMVKDIYYSLVPSPQRGGSEGENGSKAILMSKVIILGA